jgi:methionyl-tRNA formyltransferase
MGSTTESALAGLLEEFEVVTLMRSGDSGDPVIRTALDAGVAIETDLSIPSIRRTVEDLDPACVVVSSYNRILPADLVSKVPFVNVHYAPLPRYRGRATVNWAIINGDSHTAISIHELVPELDGGGILFQEMVPIGDQDTVTDLYASLNEIQRVALPPAVARLLGGDHGEPQDESCATYACTRTPADGEIDWTRSAVEIDRLVRALTDPFPGAFTWLGSKKIIVDRIELDLSRRYEGVVHGRVLRLDRKRGYADVLTGNGIVRLLGLRVDGLPVRATDMLCSTSNTLGSSVGIPIDPTKSDGGVVN